MILSIIARLSGLLATIHLLKQTGLTFNYAWVLSIGSSASSVTTGYRALADWLVQTKLASLMINWSFSLNKTIKSNQWHTSSTFLEGKQLGTRGLRPKWWTRYGEDQAQKPECRRPAKRSRHRPSGWPRSGWTVGDETDSPALSTCQKRTAFGIYD